MPEIEGILGSVRFEVVVTEEPTNGPLESVMLAEDFIGPGELVIHNCDTFVEFGVALSSVFQNDIVLPVFSSNDPAYSYVFTGCDEEVVGVQEKTVSPSFLASTGTYIFRNGEEFKRSAREFFRSFKSSPEVFVSHLIDFMLKRGARARTLVVPKCYPIGTESELRVFDTLCSSLEPADQGAGLQART